MHKCQPCKSACTSIRDTPCLNGPTNRSLRSSSDHISPEAILAKDADKLECIVQAREYQTHGYQNVEPWITSNFAKLKSDSARTLGVLSQELFPDEWWKTFGRAYANNSAPAQDPGKLRPSDLQTTGRSAPQQDPATS